MVVISPTYKWNTSWWLNHPFEKYARQIGSFPQVGVKIENIGNHQPEYIGVITTTDPNLLLTSRDIQAFNYRLLGPLERAKYPSKIE